MKLNLLKKLLCLSPVVISPILVTACGNSNNGGKDKIDALKLKTAALKISKVAAPGKFYLDFYQRELNAVWATKTAAINAAATDTAANHQYDLQINVLNEVLTKVKTDGATEFKKEFPTLDNYNADIFDDITVSFTIPDDSKGNLKLADNGVLSVYPASFISGATSEKHISYTLKLNSPEVSAKDLSGSLKLNLKAGFLNYTTSSSSPLNNDYIRSIAGSTDMSTILVGENGGGLDVGTRTTAGGYAFVNYSTASSGKEKLANNQVLGVYGNADMSTILVGEDGGGLDVGTRAKASDPYTFTNYAGGAGKPLGDGTVLSVTGSSDLSTILVGENYTGLDVGTRASASDPYTFTNYAGGSGKPLARNSVQSVAGNADLSTIFVGENNGGGLDVGTRASASDPYTFTNYAGGAGKPLANGDVGSVFSNANMSTILVGELGGGLDVGTRAKADDPYTFTNYSTASASPLANDSVISVNGSADLSTILVGTFLGGLSIGTRASAADPYTFTNTLPGDYIYSTAGTADLSTILVADYGGGLDISSNLWFA